jgi:ABC-type transporter Mla maintaining outer membrane lipid asymmetry ATPase subunit MlaF
VRTPQQQPVLFGIGPGKRELSSGELAMLRFAAQAAGSAERGCLFLFDEPETHLHPNFVSEFMAVLNTILAATQSVAIIVTHSAYIVREVPSQRVRIFSLEDRKIAIDRPRLQTFGASIDSISQFVFADTSISHQYQETLQTWLDSLGSDISIEGIIERFGNQMNSETLSYVARLIRSRS